MLSPDQLRKAAYIPGLAYAEEQGRAWEKLFKVKGSRPLTLLVSPNGTIVWQQEGKIQTAALADALVKHLVRNRGVWLSLLRANVRIGHTSPNFLFEYAPGRELTLRKLAGPATLVFWKCISRPSIEAVRELQRSDNGKQSRVVLAINDGDQSEVARKCTAENGLSATLVPDPRREISRAYGVNIWPTVVFIDASGLVRAIRYARMMEREIETSVQAKAST